MTDVQLLPPLPTRPAAPAFFAVSSLTLAVTGVALFAILGLGVAFLASQNRAKTQDKDDGKEDGGGSSSSSSASSSSPPAEEGLVQDSQFSQDVEMVRRVINKFSSNLVGNNVNTAIQITENIDTEAKLEAACRFIVNNFNDLICDQDNKDGLIRCNEIISAFNRKLQAENREALLKAQAADREREAREEQEKEEKELQAAIQESLRLDEESRQDKLEAAKLGRIAEYKKNPVESCKTLTQEVQGALGDLKDIDKQLKTLQDFCRRYESAKRARQPLTTKEIEKLEENKKYGFDSKFIKKDCLPQYQNEFQQRYEEVLEALPQATLGSDLYSARKDLIARYSEYAELISSINKNASAYSKWKDCRESPASQPLLPLEKDKRADRDKDDHRGDDRKGVLVAGDGEANVHSVEGGDHGWDAKDDSKRGQELDRLVQLIGEDDLVGVSEAADTAEVD